MYERYGYLTVIDTFKGSDKSWDVRCRCICDCGNECVVYRCNLRSGKTKSCGCMSGFLRGESNRKTNTFVTDGDITVGIASNTGKRFLIDTEDLPKIQHLCWWQIRSTGYIAHKNAGEPVQTLHRLLMGNPEGKVVDHINHDRTDNRKSNLRICTQSENLLNKTVKPKGIVEISRGKNKYYTVQLNGYRGCFKDYNDAKKLRDEIIATEYNYENDL